MAVRTESHSVDRWVGKLVPAVVRRDPNGEWTVVIQADLRIQLDDGRFVVMNKEIRTKATQQIGRRKSQWQVAALAKVASHGNNDYLRGK